MREILDEHRHRGEVVDREVEEALDLTGVQVDGHDAVGAGRGEHVGDETRGDRLATFGLPVLARVAVEGRHRGDALRRRALRGVDHDQLFHQPVVDRVGVRLEHEHVGAADVLAVAAVDLAVRERRQRDVAERDVQVLRDLVGELGVAAARHQDEVLLGDELHRCSVLLRVVGGSGFARRPHPRATSVRRLGNRARARLSRVGRAARRGSRPRPRRSPSRRRARPARPATCGCSCARRRRSRVGACRRRRSWR